MDRWDDFSAELAYVNALVSEREESEQEWKDIKGETSKSEPLRVLVVKTNRLLRDLKIRGPGALLHLNRSP